MNLKRKWSSFREKCGHNHRRRIFVGCSHWTMEHAQYGLVRFFFFGNRHCWQTQAFTELAENKWNERRLKHVHFCTSFMHFTAKTLYFHIPFSNMEMDISSHIPLLCRETTTTTTKCAQIIADHKIISTNGFPLPIIYAHEDIFFFLVLFIGFKVTEKWQ